MFLSVSSISSTMQDILLEKTESRKWRVERFLRKDKIIVQSRDQASKNLGLSQSHISIQVLCHYVSALLQQQRVALHAV